MSPDVEQLAEHFRERLPRSLRASPLYQALCPVVAEGPSVAGVVDGAP